MLNLVWQIPLIIFVCFVVITLFLIPYRELQKYRDKANKTEVELRDEIKRLGTEHSRKLDEVTNQLNTHFYREVLPEETNKLKVQLTALMTEIDALKSQLESLTKLVFEVHNVWSSRVYGIDATTKPFEFDHYALTASLKILLVNNDTQNPKYFWNMKLSLMRKSGNGQEIEEEVPLVGLSLVQVTDDEGSAIHYRNGLTVGAGRRAYHWFVFNFTLTTEYLKELNQHCFMRLTMEAAGQPPYRADIYIEWDKVRQPSGAYITPQTVVRYSLARQ